MTSEEEATMQDSLLSESGKLRLFYYFISERHNVFQRRFIDRLPPPWTSDTIIARYHFTNVYRLLDRGTLYYKHILVPRCTSHEELVLNTLFYRACHNYFPTQELIRKIPWIDPISETKLRTVIGNLQYILSDHRRAGNKVLTGAHLLANCHSTVREEDKPWLYEKARKIYYWFNALELVYRDIKTLTQALLQCASFKDAAGLLYQFIPGSIGTFLMYEILCDLIYTPVLNRFTLNDWVNLGPGARRGLKVIFPEYSQSHELELINYLWENQSNLFANFNLNMQYFNGKELTLRDVEHSLCEFYKYSRGYCRSRYQYKSGHDDAYLAMLQKEFR